MCINNNNVPLLFIRRKKHRVVLLILDINITYCGECNNKMEL